MNWTESEYSAYLARFHGTAKSKNNSALQTPNLESAFILTPEKAVASKETHPRFRIHIHSKRRRLCDPDGVSVKAAIDGLVLGGVLKDDSARSVVSVTYSQEKAETDETVIEVWEIIK